MTTENPRTPVPPAESPQPAAQQPYGQAAPSPYAAPQAGYGQPMPPRGLSIASMVCGIVGLVLSFFLFGFLPALAAVILGHIGMKKEPTAKGFSLTGLITGYAGLALSLLVGLIMLAAIFIPLWFVGTAASSGYLYS